MTYLGEITLLVFNLLSEKNEILKENWGIHEGWDWYNLPNCYLLFVIVTICKLLYVICN